MAHKKQGFRFKEDWDKEFLDERLKTWEQAITLPVNLEIKAEHRVLNINHAQKLLENAETISRMDCYCRESKKNCDSPTDNCLSLNDRAKMILEKESYKDRHPKRIVLNEALELLKDTYDAGLVHMAYAVDSQSINELCSCCSCCCLALSATIRYGLHPHLLTRMAVENTDSSRCIDCGACIDRCQFGARKMTDNGLVVKKKLCYGCGLCIDHCPTNAISLFNLN